MIVIHVQHCMDCSMTYMLKYIIIILLLLFHSVIYQVSVDVVVNFYMIYFQYDIYNPMVYIYP